MDDKKTAVVFAAGGTKGAFGVGVMKRLLEQNRRIDHFYGTSVGSLIGTYLSYTDIGHVESYWRSIRTTSDIFRVNLPGLLGFGDGLYNLNPIKKRLQEAVNAPSFPVTVTKVHLRTGEIVYSRNGDESPYQFIQSTLASASIPGIFNPIDDYVDGGIRELTPLKIAIADGAERIIVVLSDPPVVRNWKFPDWAWLQAVNIALRSFHIIQHEIFFNDVATCNERNDDPNYRQIELEIYAPADTLYWALETDPKKLGDAIDAGYASMPVSHF